MKPFIDDNTRKVLMVVIPLQVRHPGSCVFCQSASVEHCMQLCLMQ
jgi:hypothetical protein